MVDGGMLPPGWIPLIVEVMKSSGDPTPLGSTSPAILASSADGKSPANRTLGSFVRHSKREGPIQLLGRLTRSVALHQWSEPYVNWLTRRDCVGSFS